MAYVKNIWVDQEVERPKTYEVTNNQDGSITLTDSFGLVTELGTPVNEVNMNHIEDGIDGCAIRKHNLTETFNLGEWVLGGTGDDEGIYKSLVANNVGNAISDDTKWEKVEMGGGASRNIGEIVASTIPLTDAGLHLLDGSLISGSGIYADFVTYIAGLVSTYPNLFVAETSWQSSATQYGVCGKFVYDATANTVRLPKITGIVEGTTDVSALGDLVEAGLPDHNHTYIKAVNRTASFMAPGSPGSQSDATSSTGYASASNPIYGNSSTVQPQTIKALLYIVMATSAKTEIEVDIDEVATDLNGKVDKSSLAEVQCVVETYQNGTSWYRVWSDGWCEQGGFIPRGNGTSGTIAFLKPFSNTNYIVVSNTGNDAANNSFIVDTFASKTNSTVNWYKSANDLCGDWQACGYIEV